MTVKEYVETKGRQATDIEIYKFVGDNHDIRTGCIKILARESQDDLEEYFERTVEYAELMDEDDYNDSILSDDSVQADFNEWYDCCNAKVLVLFIED